jgi:hypothetical protein
MTVREHYRVDAAEVDPEPRPIVFDRELHRAGIEQNRLPLGAAKRPDDHRQAMICTALAAPRQLPHARTHQGRPFKRNI